MKSNMLRNELLGGFVLQIIRLDLTTEEKVKENNYFLSKRKYIELSI